MMSRSTWPQAAELEHLRDVGPRIGRAVEGADDLLLGQGQVLQADLDRVLGGRVDVGDHHASRAWPSSPVPGASAVPRRRPWRRMNLSTPRLQVASETTPAASSQEVATWVAPSLSAMSFFAATGSIATITLAPASRRPGSPRRRCRRPRRRRPRRRPHVGGVDGRAPAGDEPAAEQAGADRAGGASRSSRTLASFTTVWWAKEPIPQAVARSSPRAWWRAVPSEICRPL